MKVKGWKKLRPDSNEELERLLKIERNLTARWYTRISGEIPWTDGERERLAATMDAATMEVDHAIGLPEAKTLSDVIARERREGAESSYMPIDPVRMS